jgi:uncharacterized protein (DUF4415 family)
MTRADAQVARAEHADRSRQSSIAGLAEVCANQGIPEMASPPRRPVNPMEAAEALFKPAKKPVAPAVENFSLPNAREMVSIKLDRAVLEHFQKDGPGWQERINATLLKAIAAES